METQIRVLINNCGSQAVDIIDLLHKGNIYVVYLSAEESDAIKAVADEFILEKKEANNDILLYCVYLINMCKENNIDIFIPFKKMEEIAKRNNFFEKHGVKVLVPKDGEEFVKLNNKFSTYELLKEVVPEAIPEYYLVKNLSDFKSAFNNLTEARKEICMKYVTDIASNSFRIINTKNHSFKELDIKTPAQKSKIAHSEDYNAIVEMFEKGNLPRDLIVMEYISGMEVSCDCLKTSKGNIIVPRIKINDKVQSICKNENIMKYCEAILNYISYNTPCNIQFKLKEDGTPMLLEVNTRMSGGVMISSWATDINIPLIAVYDALGIDFDLELNWKDVKMISRMSFDRVYG